MRRERLIMTFIFFILFAGAVVALTAISGVRHHNLRSILYSQCQDRAKNTTISNQRADIDKATLTLDSQADPAHKTTYLTYRNEIKLLTPPDCGALR